jgi:hypothetical protein
MIDDYDLEGDNRSLSPLAVSWESNKSSSNCNICSKQFGRLTHRRHHCRYCGRLVCGSCSSHKVNLPNQKNDNIPVNDGEEMKDQEVRVCDPCFRILTAKEKKIIEKKQFKERKAELLTTTSYISNCLIEVYFLDGKSTTLSFDESTTVQDIVTVLFSSMKIALFEVAEDICDPTQYLLLLNHLTIGEIVLRWQNTGQKFAKLVFPVHDSAQIKSPLSALVKGMFANDEGKSTLRQEIKPKSSSITESSDSEQLLLQVILLVSSAFYF